MPKRPLVASARGGVQRELCVEFCAAQRRYVWLATFYRGWFTFHQSQTQQMPLHVVADGMFARVIGARGAEAVCQCEVFIWFVYLTSNSESCRAWPLSPFLCQTGLIATIGGTSPLLASTGFEQIPELFVPKKRAAICAHSLSAFLDLPGHS